MAEPQTTEAAAPAAPPEARQSVAERLDTALSEAFKREGIVKPTEPAKAAAAPAAPPPPAPAETPALAALAKKQAEFRKEREQVEPYIGMLKAFTPQEAQRLAQARASGHAAAALRAMGFTHSDYAASLLDAAGKPRVDEEPASAAPPAKQVDPEIEELRRFKQQYEQEKAQGYRQQALTQIENLVSANPKFSHVAALGEYESIERALIKYHSENGELPGATFDESVALAAEVVEADLRAKAEKWKKVLTPSSEPAPIAAKAPESPPSPGSEVQPRTLTNADTTAPAARTSPRTREERIAALLKDPNFG